MVCAVAAGAAGLRAQSTSGEKVKQAVKDAKEDARETKADFEKRVKADLDELDAKIDQLGKKMSAMGEDGRKKAKAEAKELKKKRQVAGKKFAKAKAASKKEWERFKVEVDEAVGDLKKAYEDFKKDLS